MWKYQDIPLLNFDNVFACIENKKDSFPRKIWTCIQSTLEEEDDSEILFTHVVHFWNTGVDSRNNWWRWYCYQGYGVCEWCNFIPLQSF